MEPFWIVFFGCVGVASADVTADLNQIISDFWAWRMREVPEFATDSGVNTYNDKLESFAYEKFETRKNECQNYLNRLKALDSVALAETDTLNYEVLKNNLELYVTGYEWRNYGMLTPLNFLEGIHIDFTYLVSSTPFGNKLDYDNYLSRLRALPTQVNQMMDLMKRAIIEGTTNHNVSMASVPGQMLDITNKSFEDTVFYEPFGDKLENKTNIDESAKTELRGEAQDVITNYVQQVFRNLSSFITTEYMPKARSEYGVGTLRNGQDYYKACLKWHLSTDQTPDEVHQKGLEEVARLKTEMEAIMKKTGFEGTTLVDFFDFLRNDSRFYLPNSNEILQRYREIIFVRIKPKLTQLFNDVPDYPLEVRPMLYDGPGGAYSSPSVDGSQPGIFWVNLRNPEKRATFDMPSLSLHEADPGHHMQASYMMRENNSDFRKYTEYSKYFAIPFHFPFFTAYSEGWALYAEDLGEEMKGSYADDYEWFGKLSSEMFRACRLVVDTGLHAKGWSRQEAIDYMVEHTFDLKSQLIVEIDRYITWPGQACAYKIGQLKIRELRNYAQEKLGDKFDVRKFHDVILRLGSVPLSVMQDQVNVWVKHQMPDTTSPDPTSSDPTNSADVVKYTPLQVLLITVAFVLKLF